MKDSFVYDDKEYTAPQIEAILKSARENAKSDSRFLTVLDLVEGKKILDVGCHVGLLSRILAERGKEVVGVDTLESAVKIAQTFNQVEGVRYRCGDLFDLKYDDGEFDCILFLETVEHLYDPSRFLKEFHRILKPGGCLIISTPNAVSYINILYQLLLFSKKRQRAFAESLKDEPRNTGTQLDHIFLWDFRTLVRYLVRNGFEYSSHKFVGAPPFKVKIGKFSMNVIGKKEMRFLFPILGPYLTTLVVKVVKR